MRHLRTAVAAAALTAALAVAGSASAQLNTFEIGNSAQLGPEGATVTLATTVNCDPGLIGYLTVTVAQSTGSRLAQGSGTSAITCTGADDTISVLVGNSPGVFPYKQGKASASATLTVFDPVTFQSTTSTAGPQEIRVHR